MLRAAPSAQVLSALQPADLVIAAEILADGGVAALPFNGMFALFGDIDQPRVHARIMAAKNRPTDKRLAMVTLPEHAHELVTFTYPEYKVLALWQDLHGLGIILPSTQRASEAQQEVQHTDGTTLLVWTEYPPLRRILEHFRAFGGQALFGTSANKSGLQTYTTTREVFRDFFTEVDVIVADEFSTLPAQRRQSMTILDLTSQQPHLHRPGSVRVSELHSALKLHGFPALRVGASIIPRR